MAISGEKNSEKSLCFWFKMATFSAQNRLRDCKMTHDFLNKSFRRQNPSRPPTRKILSAEEKNNHLDWNDLQ